MSEEQRSRWRARPSQVTGTDGHVDYAVADAEADSGKIGRRTFPHRLEDDWKLGAQQNALKSVPPKEVVPLNRFALASVAKEDPASLGNRFKTSQGPPGQTGDVVLKPI